MILKKAVNQLHSVMLKLLILSIFSAVWFTVLGQPPVANSNWKQSAGGPKTFVENKGQMTDLDGNAVPFVLFRQEAPGLNLYITEKGLTYAFLNWRKVPKQPLSEADVQDEERTGKKKMKRIFDWSRIDMTLKNASIKRENIIREGRSTDFSQYFLGHCPEGIKDVRSHEKITIKEVYPGIDWVFYNSTEKGVKYDFIVHPGADPAHIKLIYRTKEKLDIDEGGNIRIQTAYGDLTESSPISYMKETKEDIPTKFVTTKVQTYNRAGNERGYETEISFSIELPTPNPQPRIFVIDPQLYWATFFGGGGFDGPKAVTTDNAGNVFVTGYTESANFPTQNGGGYFQGTFSGGGRDVFIQKFTNAGVRLWATYYGGNQSDDAWSLAVDNAGNLFVTGTTESTNFPVQNLAGAYNQAAQGGQGDAFFLKFDNAGNRLWATYYGGISMEEGFGITIDPNGNIFATGETRSATTFPTQTAGTFFQGTFGTGTSDAYIIKFNNGGNRLWATYAGGWNTDMGQAITTDANGNVFVTGYAWGGGFPLQNAGTFYQAAIAGSGDIFIMKFDNLGNLLWSTYYGGGAVDEGSSIATDASGNVFITGTTAATNFPTQNPGGGAYFQGTKSGTWDTYMLKFDNLGNRLWATYFGGSGFEAYKEYTFDNLAIDDCGNVYMSVETASSDVPTQTSCDPGFNDNTYNGGNYDIFLTQFSNTGVYLWGTYLGGDGDDFRTPIALDNNNSLFVSGEWTDGSPINAASYPLTNPGGGAYNNSFTGGHDGFMTKFTQAVPTLSVTPVNASCGCTGSATANPAGICAPFTYVWSNGQTTQTATGLCAGAYTVTVANKLCGLVTNSVTITSSGGFTITPTSTPAACLSSNGSATVTPTGGASPFTYAWSPSGGSSATATGLSTGNYTVLVTDGSGCTETTSLTITSSGGPTVVLANQTNVLCSGGANGSASMNAAGGTSPYTYSWSPSGGSTSAATGLNAGTYTTTVADASGCLQTETVTITEPPALTTTVSSTPAACGNSSGTASVTAGGGTPNYSYSWSNGGTTSQISNLSSQTYSVTISDGNGCTTSTSVTVVSSGSVTAIANNATICAGQTTTLSASGGANYLWSSGQSSTSITVSPTASATYSVIVSTGGCSDTAFAMVTISPPPNVSAGNNLTVCTGSTVTLTATGGGTYVWNTGQSSASITATVASAATYSVLVTNASGCTGTSSVSVFTTPSIVANVGPDQTICVGSSASLSASGGTGYSWNPSTGLSDPNIYNPVASPGSTTTYTVIVTSGICTPASAVITVVVTPGPIAVAASNVTITSGQTVTLTASGGGTYVWSNGSTGGQITDAPTATTIYCVTVTDAMGCSDVACATVYIEPVNCAGIASEDVFVVPNAFSPNGDGQNDNWKLLYLPLLVDCIVEFQVAIYNRWGEKVFEGTDINFSWNGKYKDKIEDTAVFGYYIDGTLKDGTKIKKKGNISLLR